MCIIVINSMPFINKILTNDIYDKRCMSFITKTLTDHIYSAAES